MDVRLEIVERLRALGIEYRALRHPRAECMADCEGAARALQALMPKNLFLTPRNKSQYYLLIVRPDAPFRTADVSKRIGASRLSFGDEEALWALLRTRPGAISPLGLMFDADRRVKLLIDEALRGAPRLAFHPNDNEETLAMSGEDFHQKFLRALGVEPEWVYV